MVNELLVFLAWVCVIKSQIGVTAIGFCDLEVKPDSLSVTDMKVTIWLRWESGMNFTLSESQMLCQVFWCVTNINIASDKLRNIDFRRITLFLLYGSCCSSSSRCLLLCLASLLTLAITRRCLSDERNTLAVDLIADHSAVSPLETFGNFSEEQAKVKVVFLFFNSSSVLCEQRVNRLIDLSLRDDDANTSFDAELSLVEREILSIRLHLCVNVLDTLVHLIHLGPFSLDNVLGKGFSKVGVVRLQLGCKGVQK